MRIIAIIGLIALCLGANAQKEAKPEFNKKTQTLTLDDQFLLKLVDVGKTSSPTFHVDVYDKDNQRVMRVDSRSFKDFEEVSETNPKGKVYYSILSFPTLDLTTEVSSIGVYGKSLAKGVYDLNFIVAGNLDEQAVKEFVKLNGVSPYSSRQ